ncbi:MAG: cytochrome C oxidase subunit IV family protein [Actinomycetes bacterium]
MSTETATTIPTDALDGADKAYPRERQYVWVALALGALTCIEIATYAAPGFPMWSWGDKAGLITVLMILMAVKFWTVAYFFMHLKFDKPILTRLFYAGLVLAVLVYLAVLTMFNVWWPGHH